MVKVVTAVRRELRELGELDSALGAGAVALARRLDDPATVSTAVPACVRELRESLTLLRRQASEAGSDVDRMSEFEQRAAERDRRRAASS